MRLDVISADRTLTATVDTTWIDHVERGADRPSDHAALLADFDLTRLPGVQPGRTPSFRGACGSTGSLGISTA